eukprot:TRINITY_DN1403_c0_g1_i1.p1 TRINITY_DN1403_c0_g1~~TRINITY_DN1403_c0_g1_i1.p1  ORF type:complete len:128 (-),score=29.38 TRINITY_DN1403_c0_g1_i1:47-397(-)
MASNLIKRSTGLVGLAVVPNAREVLSKLYQQTLKEIRIIPQGAYYRQHVEDFTKFRLGVVEKETDIRTIEGTIKAGQVEELIVMAKNELFLIPKMAEWKPWEIDSLNPPKLLWTKA